MNKDKLNKMVAGIEPWIENFGQGMERRGKDDMSWYDLSINCNSIPYEPDLAIIVTSWMGHLKWLKAVLRNYRLANAFVILAYDNPFYAWGSRDESQKRRCMPSVDHYLLANSVVHKHITYDSDKRNGWFWDVRYAQGILRGFENIKYVYVTNGDCICEKPEGFRDLINLLGEADLMGGQSSPGLVHTADFICKIDAFNKVYDHMAKRMRVPVIGSWSPEVMLREAIDELSIKLKHPEKLPRDPDGIGIDWYTCYNQDSTWKDVLGYRNLFAEQETAWNQGLEPLPAKYLDGYEDWIYFSGDEKETVCKFYETGDRRYVYMWWDRGEDSDYNRLYYPLEHYGKEPIYNKD